MLSLPVLPDESPGVSQAIRRLAQIVKANAKAAANSQTVAPEASYSTTSWSPLPLTDPAYWTVDRTVEGRKEGSTLRLRGLIHAGGAIPSDKVIATLPEAYRPTADMLLPVTGGAALKLAASTGEFTFTTPSPSIVYITFDSVVIPL